MNKGKRYLLQVWFAPTYLSTFFYISHLVIGCCRSFYSFTIHRSRDFVGLNLVVREILIGGGFHPHTTVPYHPRLFLPLLSRFASFAAFAGPFLRRLRRTPIMANQKWLT